MDQIKIKIPVGLLSQIALQRTLATSYQTHRGFKAFAFYTLVRNLTTSAGIYRGANTKRTQTADGLISWSAFNKQIASQIGLSFNTVCKLAEWAKEFGFIAITDAGYHFTSMQMIAVNYNLYYPDGEIKFNTLTITPQNESLEHILKTIVIQENFDRQEYAVMQKIKQIPGGKEKLGKYIHNWHKMQPKQLLAQIVAWQKATFLNPTNGTEAYNFFHSIHADIALTVKGIARNFAYACTRSSVYLKKALQALNYITVSNRALISNATHKPHEPNGKCKPITFIYLPRQKQRKWLMPDLITLNLKNL